MITTHDLNSAWWGRPVALVTDAAWFAQDEKVRTAQLAPYAWAEFKAALPDAPLATELQRAGFAWIDTQINFRIALPNVPDSPSLAQYECLSATEHPFEIGPAEVRPFEYERALQLPGVTTDMLRARYTKWANDLIAAHPDWCLRLVLNGQTQGWFLSETTGSGIRLTLAMLAVEAVASGQHLYQRALREYARRGCTIGHAAFSVRNTPVMNIYASLGARFTPPTGVWLWTARP